jgi:hypothetical protein
MVRTSSVRPLVTAVVFALAAVACRGGVRARVADTRVPTPLHDAATPATTARGAVWRAEYYQISDG